MEAIHIVAVGDTFGYLASNLLPPTSNLTMRKLVSVQFYRGIDLHKELIVYMYQRWAKRENMPSGVWDPPD